MAEVLSVCKSVLGFCFGWWQKRERVSIDPKKFSPAHDLEIRTGGFDVETMRHTSHKAKLGVEPAKLKLLVHNLTATPVTIVELQLLNADDGDVMTRENVKTQRIDGNDFVEIDVPIDSSLAPCNEPPAWRGRIKVKTVRRKAFFIEAIQFRRVELAAVPTARAGNLAVSGLTSLTATLTRKSFRRSAAQRQRRHASVGRVAPRAPRIGRKLSHPPGFKPARHSESLCFIPPPPGARGATTPYLNLLRLPCRDCQIHDGRPQSCRLGTHLHPPRRWREKVSGARPLNANGVMCR